MRKPYSEESIGTEEANRLASEMLKYAESRIMKSVAGQVRHMIIKQMGGIFKNFYVRPDGTYGHVGIENTIRANALDKVRL